MLETAVRVVKDLERQGASEAEGYAQEAVERIISFSGEWSGRKKKDATIALRTLMGKKKGFAAGTLPMCSLEEVELASLALCRNVAPDPAWVHLPFAKPRREPGGIYDEGVARLGEEELMELVGQVADTVMKRGGVPDVIVSARVERTAVANSHGVEGEYQSTRVDFSLMCKGEREAGGSWHGRAVPDVEEATEEVIEKSFQKKEISHVDKNVLDVIFMPEALNFFFVPCLKWAVRGDVFYMKRGHFTILGEEVASPGLTVVDDGLLCGGLRSAPFDGEGNPMEKTILLEKGILKTVLHSEYTALKVDGVSTGNGMRSATSEPVVDTTNFVLHFEGSSPLETLREEMGEGVVLETFVGDVDPSGGNFNGHGEGYVVEKGEIGGWTRIQMVGNVFELLKKVKGAGEEKECSFDSVYAPPLWISDVTVIL